MPESPLLRSALKALAERNAFNALDSGFGKSLALQERPLSDKQQDAAYRLVMKYDAVLRGHGIDVHAIPKPIVVVNQAPAIKTPINAAMFTKPVETLLQPRKLHKALMGFVFTFDIREGGQKLVGDLRSALPQAYYDAEGKWGWAKGWHVGEDLDTVRRVLKFAQEFSFEIEPEAAKKLAQIVVDTEERLKHSTAVSAEIEVEGLGGELMPFQKAGVAYLLKAKRSFLADEMGLGKTVQALAAIAAVKVDTTLVICPAALKRNWLREGKRWLPDHEFIVLSGKNPQMPIIPGDKPVIFIANYDIIEKWLTVLKALPFQVVVCDESHRLKNPTVEKIIDPSWDGKGPIKHAWRYKTMRVRSVHDLVSHLNPPYVWFLSGTPITNRPIELVPQLDIMGQLGAFGGLWKFRTDFCWNASTGRYDGCKNPETLNRLLRQTCFIRRLKKDVLTELPDKTRSFVSLPLDNVNEYRKAEHDTITFLRNRKYEETGDLEYANEYAMNAAGAEVLVRINTLRQLAAKGKVAAVVDWVHDFMENEQKLVLFAHHHNDNAPIIPTLAEKLKEYNPVVFMGGVSDEKRDQMVLQFQNNPDVRIFIGAIDAGGEGITLTASSQVAFAEFGWTAKAHDQCEDRCHRISQKDNVTAWYLQAEGTIDEDMIAIIEEKRAIMKSVHDGVSVTAARSIVGDLIKRLKVKAA